MAVGQQSLRFTHQTEIVGIAMNHLLQTSPIVVLAEPGGHENNDTVRYEIILRLHDGRKLAEEQLRMDNLRFLIEYVFKTLYEGSVSVHIMPTRYDKYRINLMAMANDDLDVDAIQKIEDTYPFLLQNVDLRVSQVVLPQIFWNAIEFCVDYHNDSQLSNS